MTPRTPPKTSSRRAPPKRPTPKPKATRPRATIEPVQPDQVRLVPAKGTPGRGGGPGGEAWRIEVEGARAGVVFIIRIDAEPVREHASSQIYPTKPRQGRRIGADTLRQEHEASTFTA